MIYNTPYKRGDLYDKVNRNFINKCIEKNFDITQEERELIMEIEFASATDENVKKLINSLLYEQSEEKRNEKIKKYLNR